MIRYKWNRTRLKSKKKAIIEIDVKTIRAIISLSIKFLSDFKYEVDLALKVLELLKKNSTISIIENRIKTPNDTITNVINAINTL